MRITYIISVMYLSFISFSCTPGMYREVHFKEIETEKVHSKMQISSLIIERFKFLHRGYKDDRVIRMGLNYPSDSGQYINVAVYDGYILVTLYREVYPESKYQYQEEFKQEIVDLCFKNNIKIKIKECTPWGINIY